MNMLVDASTRRPANIRANIKSIWMRDFLKRYTHPLQKTHDLERFIIAQIDQRGDMAIRDNHNVSTIVGIQIHDDVGGGAPVNDESIIIITLLGGNTENAFPLRAFRSNERLDVLRPPGREKSLHDYCAEE